MGKSRILIIEDDRDGLRSVAEAVADLGCEVETAETGAAGVQRFRERLCDVVLSDLVLPDIDGIEVLSRIRKLDAEAPVLIMTAYGSVASAVSALKAGAFDYLTKPLDLDELHAKVTRALETTRLRNEVKRLSETIQNRYSARSMVAASPSMREIVARVELLAPTSATVLILGESGTGKELVARALHVDGRRGAGPFVAVNCGAFADTLLDSELFGHEKGAFTGAIQQHKGAIERAEGGTLFLDEIGDAPSAVQIKLLRVIEEREIVRVGGQAPVRVDVRLISASNKDLEELVRAGKFREDLFYRLHVVSVRLPALRDRREDIRPLADRFIAIACREHGRELTSVEPEFYAVLQAHDWPGNVRQLRNVVEASVLMADGPVLKASHTGLLDERRAATGEFVAPEHMTLVNMEREIIRQALARCEGNRTLAAEKLGLSRRTIQRKIQEYNLPF